MSGKVLFDPTSDKWVLSDGEHYLEVPHWAREIIADEFERETRQLKTENDKLRKECDGWKKLCAGLLTVYACGYGELCKGCTWDGLGDSKTFSCLPRVQARELGVEVGA